jgi:hypothetical protein
LQRTSATARASLPFSSLTSTSGCPRLANDLENCRAAAHFIVALPIPREAFSGIGQFPDGSFWEHIEPIAFPPSQTSTDHGSALLDFLHSRVDFVIEREAA